MERKEQLEMIQLEFDLYEGRNVKTSGSVASTAYLNLEEVDVARSYIELEKKRNKRRRFLSGVLGKHAERFGYLDAWYYDRDDEYLDQKNASLNTYYCQIDAIFARINEDNFAELDRLMSFTRAKNKEYRTLIQRDRDLVRNSANGEEFERESSNFDIEAFNEWFKGALAKASYTQSVEKVKK